MQREAVDAIPQGGVPTGFRSNDIGVGAQALSNQNPAIVVNLAQGMMKADAGRSRPALICSRNVKDTRTRLHSAPGCREPVTPRCNIDILHTGRRLWRTTLNGFQDTGGTLLSGKPFDRHRRISVE